MSDDEKRYTLKEAARELSLNRCRSYGHSWTVVETMARPTHIVCDNGCGTTHRVVVDAPAVAPATAP